jgi:hypothetical protein
MDRVKGDFSDEISLVLKDQVYQAVKSNQQGYSSTTYFITFEDDSSIVIQFRPASRPIDTVAVSSARSRLGSLVPEVQLLKKIQNDTVFVYQMARVPGSSFNELLNTPKFIHLLPSIALGFGCLLGKCYIPGSRTGDNQAWFEVAQKHIQAAVDSDDPLVLVNRTHYRKLLDILHGGTLDDLPLAISNDDISPTNIIVDEGVLTGLVDWEYSYQWPLGWETRAVFWLMGMGTGEHYVLHDNALEIADAFWKGFGAHLPDIVRKQSTAIQSAMQIGAALSTSLHGRYSPGHFASLPVMLEYNIPPAFWSSE